MYHWLQTVVAGAIYALPHFFASTTPAAPGLLSREALEWTESMRTKYNLPGISIGVIASPVHTRDGWKNETHGLGYMNSQGRAIDGDTLFAIASNSKLFAAISVGLLIDNDTALENGDKLDYSTKIKDILPNWRMKDPYMQDHLDLLDLLSMRSGMPRHDSAAEQEDPDKIIARFQHFRPSTEIRQTMQYNNFHYWIIAEIVAHVTNGTYPEYVKTHILDPVGLYATTYNHTQAEETGRRSGSFVRAGKNSTRCAEIWAEHDVLDRSCYGQPFETSWFTTKGDGLFMAGPGGLVSSANDVLKWIRELLDPKVLPQRVIAETHKLLIPAFGETVDYDEVGAENYGQGQVTFNYRGHEVIQHGGDVPGFSTQITRLPALGIGLYLGINDDDVGGLLKSTLVFGLLDALLGLQPIDWEGRMVTPAYRKGAAHTPLPDKPHPAPSMKSLLGKYHDEGYGSLQIESFDDACALSVQPQIADSMKSTEYLQVIGEAMTTQAGLTRPLLFAHMGKLFGSVYVYTHFSGPVFNASMVNVKQNPQGKLTAYVGRTSTAVFVEGRGMGMFENFWGGSKGKEAVESLVEEKAEVWFRKE